MNDSRKKVLRVPMVGIRTSTGTKVPTRLPTVDRAYSPPAVLPADWTSVTTRRMAKGETQPSSVMGTAKSSTTPSSDPARMPALYSAKPRTDQASTGRATNGTRPSRNAAQAVI